MNQLSEKQYWAEKDKDARLEYAFDWTDWLVEGDTLAGSSWTADPGIQLDIQYIVGNQAVVWVAGGSQQTWYVLTNTVTSSAGRTDQRVLRIFVPADVTAVAAVGSALFPNRFTAVAELRRDRLLVAAAGAFPSVDVSDDYIWSKMLAAEAELQRDLRVYFQPTDIVPDDADQAEVDALVAAGQPWAQESAYDYTPNFFHGERWGYLVTKSKPIVSVASIRFVYPTADQQVFEIPQEWIRLDKKYGHIRLVPTAMSLALPVGAFTLQAISGGMGVPFMIQLRYKAGLTNAATNWPDLVDVVKKKAVLGIVTDSFLPQSGSISADGLSQSMSVDIAKYYETIETKIFGGKGANGGLMTAIHGIRMGVLGA